MAETKEITIAGTVFPVTQPYAAGHVLTEAEAKALNQVRAENVRNNTASAVKKAAEEGKAADEIAKIVADYDASYEFNVRTAGPARVVDPLERECRAIAKALLMQKLKDNGVKAKDQDKEELEAKIAEWARHPKVVAAAKKALESRKGLALSLDESEAA